MRITAFTIEEVAEAAEELRGTFGPVLALKLASDSALWIEQQIVQAVQDVLFGDRDGTARTIAEELRLGLAKPGTVDQASWEIFRGKLLEGDRGTELILGAADLFQEQLETLRRVQPTPEGDAS